MAVTGPVSELGIDIERAVGKVNLWIWLLIVKTRRNLLMLKRQYCFDQTSNASSSIKTTKVDDEMKLSTLLSLCDRYARRILGGEHPFLEGTVLYLLEVHLQLEPFLQTSLRPKMQFRI